jgi:hypothetical protein
MLNHCVPGSDYMLAPTSTEIPEHFAPTPSVGGHKRRARGPDSEACLLTPRRISGKCLRARTEADKASSAIP